MDIVQAGVDILGDNLIGLQAGNEPDFYVEFKRRQEVSVELESYTFTS